MKRIMKVLSVVLCFALILGVVGTTDVQAKSKVAKTYVVDTEAEIYKGQTMLLWATFGGTMVDGEKVSVSWRVVSGKKKVSISKDGLWVTGKKTGTAVLECTCRDQVGRLTVTVKKAPKAKERKEKIDGIDVTIPAGFTSSLVTEDLTCCVLHSTKDDTSITVASVGLEADLLNWLDVIEPNLISEAASSMRNQLESQGYLIKDVETTETEKYGTVQIYKLSAPKITLAVNYELLQVSGKYLLVITVSPNGKKAMQSAYKSFKDLNK